MNQFSRTNGTIYTGYGFRSWLQLLEDYRVSTFGSGEAGAGWKQLHAQQGKPWCSIMGRPPNGAQGALFGNVRRVIFLKSAALPIGRSIRSPACNGEVAG